MASALETLPDELLLMIYLYLEPYHILFAFLQLNARFERTLEKYKQDLCPYNMHYIDAEHLNNQLIDLIRHSVMSLTLDDEFTGGMLFKHLFFPMYPHLRSLHIRYCDEQQLSMHIQNVIHMSELKTLKIDQLTSPSKKNNFAEEDGRKVQLLKNTLYSIIPIEQVHLPGTIFDISCQYLEAHCNLIQQLFVTDTTFFKLFFRILPWSRNLRHLSVSIGEDYDFEEDHFTMLTFLPLQHLVTLHLHIDSYDVKFPRLTEILLHVAPNTLECFSLSGVFEFELPDGESWREVLSQLPRLTKFNLFCEQLLMHGTENDYALNDVYNSFASDWWVKEKKWFMTILRTDLPATESLLEHTKIYIHSDPLETHTSINLPLSSIKQIFCTRPDHLSATDRYIAVENLECQGLSGLQAFPNLKCLTLFDGSDTLPTTSNEIPNLKYLTHLTLSKISLTNIDALFSQLKTATRCLRSLAITNDMVFECFLKQHTWRGIREFQLSTEEINDVHIIERLANILPDLRFLRLGRVKYDDYYAILCDTLKYCRNLIGFKTYFLVLKHFETNTVRTAFVEYLDELLLYYTSLTIGTYKATFDEVNNTLTLWL
ncbi:unnamed protein product [Didymodactylos carnosus]|uniref:F-box domain-containing protein n=1 Tax=Didymodactylos carnosus TaxID=1234261 RepID=A0A815UYZ9_9BILA|nr:unnamed protein product [Didymodactylos carnosus]CAF1527477.1 unnamed protein product [Didymodactylos carnosus]CAF4044202.1 unnamed protein product [Didymodactylos carnosus]CAF4386607.1 unnamed protein product [Didymodactylos carnosus]